MDTLSFWGKENFILYFLESNLIRKNRTNCSGICCVRDPTLDLMSIIPAFTTEPFSQPLPPHFNNQPFYPSETCFKSTLGTKCCHSVLHGQGWFCCYCLGSTGGMNSRPGTCERLLSLSSPIFHWEGGERDTIAEPSGLGAPLVLSIGRADLTSRPSPLCIAIRTLWTVVMPSTFQSSPAKPRVSSELTALRGGINRVVTPKGVATI